MPTEAVKTLQNIDRLVSASSPSDALASLNALTTTLRTHHKNEDAESLLEILTTLSESTEFMQALCSLLSESKLNNRTIDEGNSTACELLSEILTSLTINNSYNTDSSTNKSSTLSISSSSATSTSKDIKLRKQKNTQLTRFLSQPHEGALIHSILDLLSPTNTTSNTFSSNLYTRTLALTILSQFTLSTPSLLHSQILTAPNGLHRILDLLSTQHDETIRNEAILLCTNLAKTSSASARLMIFSETYDKVLLDIAQSEWNNGNFQESNLVVICDCLKLCIEMCQKDEMGAEVFLGSKTLVNTLTTFLDLRFGRKFRSIHRGGGAGNDDYPDLSEAEDSVDLDDILNADSKKSSIKNQPSIPNKVMIPYLTEKEHSLVKLGLEMLRALIVGDTSMDESGESKRKSRQRSILSHDILSRSLFDLALYTLPPAGSPPTYYVSSVPTLEVQLLALDIMSLLAHKSGEELQAKILNTQSMYLKDVNVLERLMYIICTGGSSVGPLESQIRMSMHALGVLRSSLSAKDASLMVMHSIAPPPPPMDERSANPSPPDIPVVQKLVNTIGENLQLLSNSEFLKELNPEDNERINVNIIGAAGALDVFLTNGAGETTREMLLRIPVPSPPALMNSGDESNSNTQHSNLIDCILLYIETVSESENCDVNVCSSLLRLLSDWIPSTNTALSSILCSPSSVILGIILQKKHDDRKPPTLQSLIGILLGLCMEELKPDEEIGGWSRKSIMNLITIGLGITKYTQMLEKFKQSLTSENDGNHIGPWFHCQSEASSFMNWYEDKLGIVRKRTIHQLTITANNVSETNPSDEVDEDTPEGNIEKRGLQKLIAQQSAEIEALRNQLADSGRVIETQTMEIKHMKKVIESNPSQLNDMLDEYSMKTNALENDISNLHDEISKIKDSHNAMIDEKDKEITLLQHDLSTRDTDILNHIEENKALREDLAGLSSAYSNLETEFNRISSKDPNNVTESTLQTRGDDTTEQNTTSARLDVLIAENNKLKKDVKAANDWMSMAVKKINDQGKLNSQLSAEVKSLNSKLTQEKTIVSFQESSTKKNFEVELNSALEELQRTKTDLHKTIQEKELLQSRLNDSERYSEGQSQFIEEKKLLETEIEKLRTSLHSYEKKIDEQSAELSSNIDISNNKLKEKDTTVNELEKRAINAEELCSQLTSKTGEYEKKIFDLTVKVEKLHESNMKANKWMENAVKSNDTLKRQLEEARGKINTLNDEVANLKMETNQNGITELQTPRYEEAETSQISESIQSRLETNEQELNNLQSENDSLLTENINLNNAVEDLSNRLSEFQTWTDTAQSRISELETENDRLNELLTALQEDQADVDNVHIEELRHEKEAQEAEISALYNRISELETENLRIHQLLSASQEEQANTDNVHNVEMSHEKEAQEAMISEMNDRITELQMLLTTAHEEKEKADHVHIEAVGREKEAQEAITIELKSLRVEMKTLKQDYKFLEESKQTWLQEKQNLEAQLVDTVSMQKRLEELEESLFDKDDKIVELEGNLAMSRSDTIEFEEKKISEINTLKGEVEELESNISTLKEQLNLQERKADDSSKLIEKLNIDIRIKEDEIETLNKHLESKIQLIAERDETHIVLQKRIEDMESLVIDHVDTINNLNDQLDLKGEEISSLELKIEELSVALQESKEQAEDVVKQWQENAQEQETLIATHVDTIERQNTEAEAAISMWENRCNELNSLIEELELKVEESSVALQESKEQAEDVVKQWQEKVQEQESVIAKHVDTIDRQNTEAEAAISMWENRCNELNSLIEKLDSKGNSNELLELQSALIDKEQKLLTAQSNINLLQAKNEENEEKISKLDDVQSNSDELRKELQSAHSTLEQLEKELEIVKKSRNDSYQSKIEAEDKVRLLEECIVAEEEKRSQLKEDNEHLVQDLEKEKARVFCGQTHIIEEADNNVEMERITAEKNDSSEGVRLRLENELKQQQEALDQANADADVLRDLVSHLETELQDANEALEAHFTEDVAKKASEMATQALRTQIKQLREKQKSDRDTVLSEQTARLAAEEEVKRLQSDLALLLERNDVNNFRDTPKAADDMVKKERIEIKGLKDSLNMIVKDLEISKTKERDAEQRAANFHLHSTVLEQELVAVKSDIQFLEKYIEDLVTMEGKTKASLQTRIDELEASLDSAFTSHKTEVDKLNISIANGKLEIEEITNALAESEKANANLVYAMTIDRDQNDPVTDGSELASLRLEKSQLLAASSHFGSTLESRIRTAVLSSSGTEEITSLLNQEKQNREMAETAVSELETQIKALQKDIQSHHDKYFKYEETISTKEAEISQLLEEKSSMQDRLERIQVDMNTNIREWKEKWEVAEGKIKKFEHDAQYESAIAAEIDKIKLEMASNGSELGDITLSKMDPEERYKYVLELATRIKEERDMFHEFQSEHEDLLALLGQQDMEKTKLQEALLQFAGQDVLEQVERSLLEAG